MTTPSSSLADMDFFGLLGNPVHESLSAAMHNANFAALGMNALYVPYVVTEEMLAPVIEALPILRFKGLNVTMPLKQKVIPFLDGLDEMASLSHAVNTLYWKNGRLWGGNTDGTGFVQGLKEQGHFDPKDKRVLLFGAGGAARGVAFALCQSGVASIGLHGRASGSERLQRLSDDLNAYRANVCSGPSTDSSQLAREIHEVDLIINATSIGMAPRDDMTLLAPELIQSRHMVCDLVYVPSETRLLREARQRGARVFNGHWMLIWQGIEAFKKWTGKTANMEVMCQTVLECLARKLNPPVSNHKGDRHHDNAVSTSS